MTIMYRTESYSGSYERRFNHVLRFEVFELGNSHILDELLQNRMVSSQDLTIQMKTIIRELDENGYVDDMPENDQMNFIDRLRNDISTLAHKDIQYALWLADRDRIKELYHGTDSDIEGYETSDIIISNLGGDGILFGYEFEPCPVE